MSIVRQDTLLIGSHFTDEEKKDKIATIVAPVGTPGVIDEREASGPTPVSSFSTDLTHLCKMPLAPPPPASHCLLPLRDTGGVSDLTHLRSYMFKCKC